MFPLRFTLLGGSFFCLLGHGSFHFVPCIPLLGGSFFCLLGRGSIHFVPYIPRFFGCFGLFFYWQGFTIPNAHFAYKITSYLQSK